MQKQRSSEGTATTKHAKAEHAGHPPDEFTKGTFTAAQKILREQRLLLQKFRKENVELRTQIAELSTAGFDDDASTIGSLSAVARLAEEAETFSAKIEVEKRKIGDHERKIRDCDATIHEKKTTLATVSTDNALRKKVQQLNDSLDLAAKRFASEIANNKTARGQINELRRERKRFKQLMAQYKSRMSNVERQVQQVVGDSQGWLEERQEYVTRIEDLQNQSDSAQEEFLSQCRELKHVVRAFDAMEERLRRGEVAMPNHMGNMTAEQEEDLQKKVVKGKWQLAKEKALTDMLKEQALSFEEAFEKLQAATGYPKIEDFVSDFIRIEELNFHRFQYMHSLNMDIEKMEEEIKALQAEAQQAVAENKGKDDLWQQLKQDTLEKVHRLSEQDEQLKTKITATQQLIKELSTSARSICKSVGISDRDLQEEGIEDDADPMMVVIHILGKVESKAVQLSAYAHLLRGDRDEKKAGQEAGDADEAPEAEEKEAGGASWEVAPIYRHPRAPSVREEEEDVDDVPLSGEYIRSKLAGRGEEMLRTALASGDGGGETAHRGDSMRMRSTMASRAPSARPGTLNSTMKKLSTHPAVPTLSTSKIGASPPGSARGGAATARDSRGSGRLGRRMSSEGSRTAR